MIQKSKIIIVLFFVLNASFAQPEIEWVTNYGTIENEIGEAVIPTKDGGYLVVGGQDFETGPDDWLIIKLDGEGNILWQKTLGTTSSERAQDVKETADNGFIIAGTFGNLNGFTLIKLNEQGEEEWQGNYETSSHELVWALALTEDGGYVMGGNSNGLGSSSPGNGLFMKIDSLGNLEWEKQYGGSSREEIFTIEQTDDLGYIAAGRSASDDGDLSLNKGGFDLWVIKMDVDGDVVWSKSYGGSQDEVSESIIQIADGGYLVAGYTRSNDGDIDNYYSGQDAWVLKLDSNGNLIWEQNFGGLAQDRAYSISPSMNGGYVISGWTRSDEEDITENKGLIDIWIFKIDDDGLLEWSDTFGGSSIDQCFDIQETIDGGFIVTGNTNSSNGDIDQSFGNFDLWVMKLAPLSVGLDLPQYYQNVDISPNPNTGQFTVNMPQLDEPANIRIINLQGKGIYTASDVDLRTRINIENLSTGIYILEVNVADQFYLSKLLID